MIARLAPVLALVVGFAAQETARAQCATWDTRFNPVGLDAQARTTLSWDDGSGPALYVGGDFTRAGLVPVNRIARWDGSAWHALGSGLPQVVMDMVVFEGELHVAASSSGVWRWDGTSWQKVGGLLNNFNSLVQTLAVFDDGSGPALYAGGSFSAYNGDPRFGIARWNGSTWVDVGGGVLNPSGSRAVYDLFVFDDGSGSKLFAGGLFTGAGSAASPDLVRWDGSSWSAAGTGVEGSNSSYVDALGAFDFGSGPVLVLGGQFLSAGGNAASNVATWNGSSYSALGAGLPQPVLDLAQFDSGSGAELIAGGLLFTGSPTNFKGTARWDGSSWQTLGGPGSHVYDLEVFDAGDGAKLVAVGSFGAVPGLCISSFDGAGWSGLPDGMGLIGGTLAFASFDDSSGPSMFAGGSFLSAGPLATKRLARWDGSTWNALPFELNLTVNTLLAWDDGSGPALYIGGAFTLAGSDTMRRIARWDGSSLTQLGLGISDGNLGLDRVEALELYDDGSGSKLYAGGVFNTAGSNGAVGIARWDGSDWSALEVGCNGPVFALKAFDDGRGPSLFVAGDFTQAGSVPANRIARWDGSAWHALGLGATNGTVTALVVYDDGSGPSLYAGGNFTALGGQAISGLGRWDGSTWHTVPKPFSPATELLVADLGSGLDLVAASDFQVFARANGTWTQIGVGNSATNVLASFDLDTDGSPDLFVGGGFATMNSIKSQSIAAFHGCGQTAESFCFGDGFGTACPCGNSGDIGHGCENSTLSGGALLAATGVASVSNDSLRLDCSGVPTNTTTLFVQATGQANGGIGSVLGDGLLCISGAVLRIGSPNADGETASVGFGSGSQAISIKGQIPQAGATRHYQARYRNVASYCTSATFNQSNGASIVWAP